jgi:16S rRNA (adenine1518-N6/adenine1519-N6)-dimethyltransferase
MRVQDLNDLLAKHGARPIKARGQHFLVDDAVVAETVAAAGVGAGDRVLEIGPGPGILTAALLDAGARVTAVEIDPKMVRILEDRFHGRDLAVVSGDILTADVEGLMALDGEPYRVVANIPYNITSPIVEKFLDSPVKPGNDKKTPLPSSMTLMVQKEVADRMLAKRGDMNALAVFVRTLARVTRVRNVARGAFFPPPEVESAVIHIVHKSDEEIAGFFGQVSKELYFRIVRAGFQGKRKQLRNSLKAVVPEKDKLEKCLNEAKISPQERPENLEIEDWKRLAESIWTTP